MTATTLPKAVELRRCAIHEAGHVIVALRLDIPISYATIDDRPHVHRLRYRLLHNRGAECLAVFCLSGGVAESLLCRGFGSDGIDRRMAAEYLSRRYGGSRLVWALEHAQGVARDLVHAYREDIETIARALLRHGTLECLPK